ncbi:MAG: ribonuclease P protein component [Gammaproteobacteria bacterium]|nr:ribonuclease P protein component [Gammaproteobacteria bacterium]MCP5425965.1 ribonuclease P protein component [Gammaproteobacteria bacterium]MCP5458847.1 ribonuclease P protein component [Gammaproteobacteria bacterium]
MMSASFGRRARLTHKADYQHVFAQSNRSGDRYFTVLARRNELGYPRLGLAVSRKVAKSAVIRNRVKRIVRESFRHAQEQLNSFDVVVIGRPQTGTCSNEALFASLRQHWARLATWAKS